MLDAWIIDEIKRREQDERSRRRAPQPQIELPHEPDAPRRRNKEEDDGKSDRGVVIVDYTL